MQAAAQANCHACSMSCEGPCTPCSRMANPTGLEPRLRLCFLPVGRGAVVTGGFATSKSLSIHHTSLLPRKRLATTEADALYPKPSRDVVTVPFPSWPDPGYYPLQSGSRTGDSASVLVAPKSTSSPISCATMIENGARGAFLTLWPQSTTDNARCCVSNRHLLTRCQALIG